MNNDLISRQLAIDALGEEPEVWTGNDEYAQGLNNQWHYDVNAVKAVPSEQPERKKGFWYTLKKGDKGYSAGDFKCSVCGEPNHTWLPRSKFCSNCGAEMSIYEEPVK